MRKIKMHIGTGYAGAEHVDFVNVPDDWDEMSEQGRQRLLDEHAEEFLANNIEYGAWLVDDVSTDEDYRSDYFSDAND